MDQEEFIIPAGSGANRRAKASECLQGSRRSAGREQTVLSSLCSSSFFLHYLRAGFAGRAQDLPRQL